MILLIRLQAAITKHNCGATILGVAHEELHSSASAMPGPNLDGIIPDFKPKLAPQWDETLGSLQGWSIYFSGGRDMKHLGLESRVG